MDVVRGDQPDVVVWTARTLPFAEGANAEIFDLVGSTTYVVKLCKPHVQHAKRWMAHEQRMLAYVQTHPRHPAPSASVRALPGEYFVRRDGAPPIPCLVLERLHTDLFREPSRVRFLEVAYSIVYNLVTMHRIALLHGDIKPENIMLLSVGGAQTKFIDFTHSVCLNRRDKVVSDVMLGTPRFAAPEVVHQKNIGLPSDIWSLGTTLYELYTGNVAFPDEDHKKNFNCTEYRCRTLPRMAIPHVLFDLVRGCVQWRPEKRLTAKQVLMHPFFHPLRRADHRAGTRRTRRQLAPLTTTRPDGFALSGGGGGGGGGDVFTSRFVEGNATQDIVEDHQTEIAHGNMWEQDARRVGDTSLSDMLQQPETRNELSPGVVVEL